MCEAERCDGLITGTEDKNVLICLSQIIIVCKANGSITEKIKIGKLVAFNIHCVPS